MIDSTTILALTGPPCAGKSTVVELLRESQVPAIDTGDMIREKANERYEDPNEDEIWETSQNIRDSHGLEGPTAIC